jgi:hypothetical protein
VTVIQVQAAEGCQLADSVRQLLQAAAAVQVQAAEGCELADGVGQLLHLLEADLEAVEVRDAMQRAPHVPGVCDNAQVQLLQLSELHDGRQSQRAADAISLQEVELPQLGEGVQRRSADDVQAGQRGHPL